MSIIDIIIWSIFILYILLNIFYKWSNKNIFKGRLYRKSEGAKDIILGMVGGLIVVALTGTNLPYILILFILIIFVKVSFSIGKPKVRIRKQK